MRVCPLRHNHVSHVSVQRHMRLLIIKVSAHPLYNQTFIAVTPLPTACNTSKSPNTMVDIKANLPNSCNRWFICSRVFSRSCTVTVSYYSYSCRFIYFCRYFITLSNSLCYWSSLEGSEADGNAQRMHVKYADPCLVLKTSILEGIVEVN